MHLREDPEVLRPELVSPEAPVAGQCDPKRTGFEPWAGTDSNRRRFE